MRKLLLGFFVVLAAMAGGTIANADTIDFSQFGPEFTTLSSPLTGVTTGGVSVTLTSPTGGFTVLKQSSSWYGNFQPGAPILFDGYGPGSITMNFATGISSLTLAGESNYYGPFTETAYAYSGAALVDTATASSVSAFNPGTAPVLTVTGTDITEVVWGSTNDGVGLALYGGAGAPSTVPEPGTMMLLGLGMAGLAVYGKRRQNNKA